MQFMARPVGSKSKFRTERPPLKPRPNGNPNGAPRVYTTEVLAILAESLEKWLDEDDNNIFIYRWCKKEKVPDDLVDDWARQDSRFNVAYCKYKARQKSRVCEGAVLKEFSDGFSKFFLSCNHGMVDKTALELSSSPDNPLNIILGLSNDASKDLLAKEDAGDASPAS